MSSWTSGTSISRNTEEKPPQRAMANYTTPKIAIIASSARMMDPPICADSACNRSERQEWDGRLSSYLQQGDLHDCGPHSKLNVQVCMVCSRPRRNPERVLPLMIQVILRSIGAYWVVRYK